MTQNPKYDLEERTAKFGENVILFLRKLPKDDITKPLINQLVKAATSVGANYFVKKNRENQNTFYA